MATKTNTIIAIIKNNTTGEVRECPTFKWEVGQEYTRYEGPTFYWLDGNGGCDCNRSIYFKRAGNEEEHPAACGDDRYSLLGLKEEGTEVLFWSILDEQ